MSNIKFYEVSREYIEYLLEVEPHLFRNKKPEQMNERKYIGIVLCVNGMDYFAPLSSYKDKHQKMAESVDFIKVKRYAVINLNNMFPVPKNECTYVDINQQKDSKYKSLLLAEYRVIKTIQDKIRKNAMVVYQHKIINGCKTALSKRCNDFRLLEKACKEYSNEDIDN